VIDMKQFYFSSRYIKTMLVEGKDQHNDVMKIVSDYYTSPPYGDEIVIAANATGMGEHMCDLTRLGILDDGSIVLGQKNEDITDSRVCFCEDYLNWILPKGLDAHYRTLAELFEKHWGNFSVGDVDRLEYRSRGVLDNVSLAVRGVLPVGSIVLGMASLKEIIASEEGQG
jgi:hypothetical protein